MEMSVSMEYDDGPFDITRTRLPYTYGGHNIQAVYGSAPGRESEKAGLPGLMDGGSVPARVATRTAFLPSWTYAFQLRPEEMRFDKREQALKVYCRLWKILTNGAADGTKNGFRVDYVPQVDNRLVCNAANGGRSRSKRSSSAEYSIAFGNIGDFDLERGALPGTRPKNASLAALDDALRGDAIVVRIRPGRLRQARS
jgi:hypothetical protein